MSERGMVFGELCAGIGGLGAGLERSGMSLAFYAEIEAFPSECMSKTHPGIPNFGNMFNIDYHQINDWLHGSGIDTGDNPIYDCEMAKNCPLSEKRFYKMTLAQAEQACELYAKGFSCGEIGEFYGVTRQSIWGILKVRKVEMRPQLKFGSDNHFYRGGSLSDDPCHNITERAIERGILVRPDICENCNKKPTEYVNGRNGIEAHHDDYNKPLAVRWLCKDCHYEWHTLHVAVAKEVFRDAPAGLDLLAGGIP